MKHTKTTVGTTLIEIVVYFGLLSVLLFAAITFALNVLVSSKSSDTFHELQSNMDYVVNRIVGVIAEADSVNGGSVFDVDAGRLSLNVANAQNSPTQFSIADGKIYMQQGAAAAVQLNSNQSLYTKFRFHRITAAKTPDQIVMDFDAALDADMARLDKTVSTHLSVSLRK